MGRQSVFMYPVRVKRGLESACHQQSFLANGRLARFKFKTSAEEIGR